MALPLYLAMTAAEFARCSALPAAPAWMGCSISPDDGGLWGVPPSSFPAGMLVFDDRFLPARPEPERIRSQLLQLWEAGAFTLLLLDFQRPVSPGAAAIVQALGTDFPCPVGAPPAYAADLTGPVFLPPLPLRASLPEYLRPWRGRELWLELAPDHQCVTITAEGASTDPDGGPEDAACLIRDPELHCSYQLRMEENRAVFKLRRTAADLSGLLREARSLGVTRCVGLWQELGKEFCK